MAPVLALAGAGDMATATAVRMATTHTAVVGDPVADRRDACVAAVRAAGGTAHAVPLDITGPDEVAAFARACRDSGRVTGLLVAAGLSPAQAEPGRIVEVDLLGVLRVLDTFVEVLVEGGAAVVVASIAGHLLGAVDPAVEAAWTHLPVEDLRHHPDLTADALAGNPALAYMRAKRAIHLRVRAAAGPWGARGLRINTVSPGVIDTAMGRAELSGPDGAGMELLVAASPVPRLGTADEVAAATTFLLGPGAGFITGTDLTVDGGSVATALLPPAPAT
ncbi:MAG TPA: SDR family oxidoreductase [Microthrixaceae bacterium]|nr:SDR family oxidoreductase [Microthrixaceae bacterium]